MDQWQLIQDKLSAVCECEYIPLVEDLMQEEEEYQEAERELKRIAGIV